MATEAVLERPEDVESIQSRVGAVCSRLARDHAELVELTVELIRDELWAEGGMRSPEHWLQVRAGLSPGRARDIVRLARRAGEIPSTVALMHEGRVGVDQAAVVAAHVPAEFDKSAAQLVPYATVSQLRRSLSRYQFLPPTPSVPPWPGDPEPPPGPDPLVEAPALSMGSIDGRFSLRFTAPADLGALVEQAIREATDAMHQDGAIHATHADGLIEVATRSLAAAPSRSRTDRFRIHVFLDTAGAMSSTNAAPPAAFTATPAPATDDVPSNCRTPGARAARGAAQPGTPAGAAPDSHATPTPTTRPASARGAQAGATWLGMRGAALPDHIRDRMTCTGHLSPIWVTDGSPVAFGRTQRIVPQRLRVLILSRDGGCRYPGCASTHHLDVHHLIHWIDGGATDQDNLMTLCGWHHDRHHDGAFSVTGDPVRPDGLRFRSRGGGLVTPFGARSAPDLSDTRRPMSTPPSAAAAATQPRGPSVDVDGERDGPTTWTGPTGEILRTRWLSLAPDPSVDATAKQRLDRGSPAQRNPGRSLSLDPDSPASLDPGSYSDSHAATGHGP